MTVDFRKPLGSVAKEVGRVHGSVQGMKGAKHPQSPQLGSEVSRGPAHIAPQAVPGAVVHEELDQLRLPLRWAAKQGEKMHLR